MTSFPDGPLDPKDPDVCPRCGAHLDDFTERDAFFHLEGCAPRALKDEMRGESEREERR